jgi:multiple sugar transport system substrate-binding protein
MADSVRTDSPVQDRKKWIVRALQLALLIAAIWVAAMPAKPNRAYPQRQSVRFWHMWSGEWKDKVEQIVKEFNESQEQYEVIALSVPGSSADYKFMLSVAGGDPPDCMAQWNAVIPFWADHDLLVPLDTLMTEQEKADFERDAYPVAKKIGKYKDHLYGVTIGINIWACYYRPEQVAAAGLDPDKFPTKLEELIEWGEKLDQYDKEGRLSRMGFHPEWLHMYAPIHGGGFWNAQEQKLSIKTPENLRALTFLADRTKKKGYYNITKFQSSLNTGGYALNWPFISGQYTIVVDGQWRVEQIAQYARELNYRTAPIPAPAGGKTFAGHSNGNFMIVPKGAKNVPGAWAFIKFWSGINDPERAAKFYTMGGWLPLTTKIANAKYYQEYLRKYPQFKTFLDVLPSENISTLPPVPYQTYFSDMMSLSAERALRGELTPEQSLDEFQAKMDAEMAKRKRVGL